MPCSVPHVFDRYCKAADFFGEALGSDVEIVVQDVRAGSGRIVHIAGDRSVTGRKIGSPLTDLGLRIVKSEIWRDRDYLCGYMGTTPKGKRLKSSTFFIKTGGQLIGMMCINQDYDRIANAIHSLELLQGASPLPLSAVLGASDNNGSPANETTTVHAEEHEEPEVGERFFETQEDAIENALRQISPTGSSVLEFTAAERQSIVRSLDEMGLFLMKGAVRQVAQRLGCSVPSVYRYLQQSREDSAQPTQKPY